MVIRGLALAAGLLVLSGCMAARQTLDEIDGSMGFAAEGTVIEAYIEYPGPAERWAGPQSLLVRVSAKDGSESGQVLITPELFSKLEVRSPKGVARMPAPMAMDTEATRAQLAELAAALQQDGEDTAAVQFRGCLYPVRVRLVRSDGAIMEKHGCRAHEGWTAEVSRLTSVFLADAMKGRSGRSPASD